MLHCVKDIIEILLGYWHFQLITKPSYMLIFFNQSYFSNMKDILPLIGRGQGRERMLC